MLARGMKLAGRGGGGISALQRPALTFLLPALHSSSTEHAGKRVCTTSLCWRQLRLLPASLHPTVLPQALKMLQPLSSGTAVITKWPQILSVTFIYGKVSVLAGGWNTAALPSTEEKQDESRGMCFAEIV